SSPASRLLHALGWPAPHRRIRWPTDAQASSWSMLSISVRGGPGGQRFDGESRLAPALDPTAQGVDLLVSVSIQEKGYAGARRLSRLRAVEDHVAVFRDHLLWIAQRFGRNPARARDPVWRRLDVQGGPQVDDHRVLAGLQSSLELQGRDPSPPQMTEESTPSGPFHGDVGDS